MALKNLNARASLDSASRPIMAPSARASVRLSTYSAHAPTITTTDSARAEIQDIETGLTRLENKALASQRVALTDEQVANMKAIALGAKLERALARRLGSQDAEMRPRRRKTEEVVSEKTPA